MDLPPEFLTLYSRLDRQGPGTPEDVLWALGRLDKTRFAAEKADRLELEHDEDVRGEWQAVNQ